MKTLLAAFAAVGHWLRGYADDLLVLAGAALAVYGISLIYAPAAWITAGLAVIAAGVFVARGGA
ncbi:MAG TPA: hypothetical protein VNG95_00615 [Gemmatimonadales bacterium]|nr:hypothetical protein [Gemmatimonadales bacterium]